MAKLKSYPESINNVTLPNEPTSWSTRRDVVENVGTTEAGTDVVDIMRVGKLTITASYNVSSTWLVQFEGQTLRPRNVGIHHKKYANEELYLGLCRIFEKHVRHSRTLCRFV